jgi:hypothetical protein
MGSDDEDYYRESDYIHDCLQRQMEETDQIRSYLRIQRVYDQALALEQTAIVQNQKISLLEKKIADMTGFAGDEPGVATKEDIKKYFREQKEYLAAERKGGGWNDQDRYKIRG